LAANSTIAFGKPVVSFRQGRLLQHRAGRAIRGWPVFHSPPGTAQIHQFTQASSPGGFCFFSGLGSQGKKVELPQSFSDSGFGDRFLCVKPSGHAIQMRWAGFRTIQSQQLRQSAANVVIPRSRSADCQSCFFCTFLSLNIRRFCISEAGNGRCPDLFDSFFSALSLLETRSSRLRDTAVRDRSRPRAFAQQSFLRPGPVTSSRCD